jgi:glycosyltransferase involved in cell wall biosynthesis
MACGRPLIVCAEGETAELVETAAIGITCRDNSESIAEAIKHMSEIGPAARAEMATRAHSTFLKSFSKERLVLRHEQLLASLCRAEVGSRN